jgi:hypothetical protein
VIEHIDPLVLCGGQFFWLLNSHDGMLTLGKHAGKLFDIFGGLFQVELVREQASNTDKKGSSKSSANVWIRQPPSFLADW